jgi:hypothetical protein
VVTRRSLAIVGVVIGLALILYALFGRQSDEERIRARLQRLADVVSFSEPGNVVARGLTLKGAFRDAFTDSIRGEIPELGSARTSRESLVELGLQSTRFARSLSLDFSEIAIEVDATRTSGDVTATAEVRAVTREGEERWDDRSVRFLFAKTSDGWQIARFRVIPPDEVESTD